MGHPAWVSTMFSDRDLDDIAVAIARVEAEAAAEVRVHLERRVASGWLRSPDALARARTLFHRLGMHRTRARNGVLVYLALDDHKLAIVGDEGIHGRVGEAYWAHVRDTMIQHLREASPGQAVVRAVEDLGRVLAEHFPRRPGDTPGDLSNQVSTE